MVSYQSSLVTSLSTRSACAMPGALRSPHLPGRPPHGPYGSNGWRPGSGTEGPRSQQRGSGVPSSLKLVATTLLGPTVKSAVDIVQPAGQQGENRHGDHDPADRAHFRYPAPIRCPRSAPGRAPTARTAAITPGMNETPVQRVVSQGEGLSLGARRHRLIGEQLRVAGRRAPGCRPPPHHGRRRAPAPSDEGAGAGLRGGSGRRDLAGRGGRPVPDVRPCSGWCNSMISTLS